MQIPTSLRTKTRQILLGIGLLLSVSLAVIFYGTARERDSFDLRILLGQELRFSPAAVQALTEEAAKYDLRLQIASGKSLGNAVQLLEDSELDLAILPGNSHAQSNDVCQVTCLRGEPLHLFVRSDRVGGDLSNLRGKRINLGPPGNTGYWLAKHVLSLANLQGEAAYQETNFSFEELKNLTREEFPDAIFASAVLPWALGQELVSRHGLQLVAIPFGDAMSLTYPTVMDLTVPAGTYGFNPPVPADHLHTVAQMCVVVAHRRVPADAVYRLLQVLRESDFSRRIARQPLEEELILRARQFPVHPGAEKYLARNLPLVRKELVDQWLNLRNMIVSLVSTAILAWTWYRSRGRLKLNDHKKAITRLELEAINAKQAGTWNHELRRRLLDELHGLQATVLGLDQEQLAPKDDELLTLFNRVDHARRTLNGLEIKSEAAARNVSEMSRAA